MSIIRRRWWAHRILEAAEYSDDALLSVFIDCEKAMGPEDAGASLGIALDDSVRAEREAGNKATERIAAIERQYRARTEAERIPSFPVEGVTGNDGIPEAEGAAAPEAGDRDPIAPSAGGGTCRICGETGHDGECYPGEGT